jgi:hypothetical protein
MATNNVYVLTEVCYEYDFETDNHNRWVETLAIFADRGMAQKVRRCFRKKRRFTLEQAENFLKIKDVRLL